MFFFLMVPRSNAPSLIPRFYSPVSSHLPLLAFLLASCKTRAPFFCRPIIQTFGLPQKLCWTPRSLSFPPQKSTLRKKRKLGDFFKMAGFCWCWPRVRQKQSHLAKRQTFAKAPSEQLIEWSGPGPSGSRYFPATHTPTLKHLWQSLTTVTDKSGSQSACYDDIFLHSTTHTTHRHGLCVHPPIECHGVSDGLMWMSVRASGVNLTSACQRHGIPCVRAPAGLRKINPPTHRMRRTHPRTPWNTHAQRRRKSLPSPGGLGW